MCLTEIRKEKSNHNDNMRPTLDHVQSPYYCWENASVLTSDGLSHLMSEGRVRVRVIFDKFNKHFSLKKGNKHLIILLHQVGVGVV